MDGRLLKALLDNDPSVPFITVKQRERLRKRIAKEKIQVPVTFSGGEYLHLVDLAGSVDEVDAWIGRLIRLNVLDMHRIPLGSPYEVPGDNEDLPPLGRRLRGKLSRAAREEKKKHYYGE